MSSNSGRKTYWESASQMAPSWTVCKGNFQCVVFFFLCQLSNLFPAFPSLAGRHLLQRPEGGLPPAALSVSLGAHPLRQEQRELARWRQQASHQLQAEQRARKKVRTASRKQALAPRGDKKWGWVLPWTQGVRGGRRGGGLLYMDTGFSSGPPPVIRPGASDGRCSPVRCGLPAWGSKSVSRKGRAESVLWQPWGATVFLITHVFLEGMQWNWGKGEGRTFHF